jgi:cardiolipin synthase
MNPESLTIFREKSLIKSAPEIIDSGSERLFFDSMSYFSSLFFEIEKSQKSVCIEVYIWANDEVSEKIFQLLAAAVKRGVRVKILVDGFGSFFWIHKQLPRFVSAGIYVEVYRKFYLSWSFFKTTPRRLFLAFNKMNQRNHKKLIIIDGKISYIGSLNMTMRSLEKKECALRLTGEALPLLQELFDHTWSAAENRKFFQHRDSTLSLQKKLLRSNIVRSNQFYFLRKTNLIDICQRIDRANKIIWLMTPYFIPSWSILRSLLHAANRGVDVRIILPFRSDLWIMRLISRLYYRFLLTAGVRIYEFLPLVLHAKLSLIDNWALIGSSNLNRRSSFLDLELDIVLTKKESLDEIEKHFISTMNQSSEVLKYVAPRFFKKIMIKTLFTFRNWL